MEIQLTTSEIRAILQGCQYTLRLVGSSRDYRKIQSSEYFSTSNNVVLNQLSVISYQLSATKGVVGVVNQLPGQCSQMQGEIDHTDNCLLFTVHC
ncbi:hypothetical protein [Nostoc sphaeroides]|uniref:Uncharacterized protein n=1 Tax=Nostoc sphaeroides CCNUC1 TaxID=2653204 RepID=A0A5P8WHH7_9NOSO|nr:hypothetical protein [Nostoc sphaeroides]QFS51616.1 hypothetical protein GXM_09110 [Nostoc sphaeroides CCNUC1]